MLETLAGISLSVRAWFCCDNFSYIFMVAVAKLTWSIKTNTFFFPDRVHSYQWTRLKGALSKALLAGFITSALGGFASLDIAGLPVAQMESGGVMCLCMCAGRIAEVQNERKNRSNYSGVWVKTPKVLKLGEKLVGHPDMSRTHWLLLSVGFGGRVWGGCWLLPVHLTSARAHCSLRQAMMEQLTWLLIQLPQVITNHIWFTEIVLNKCFIRNSPVKDLIFDVKVSCLLWTSSVGFEGWTEHTGRVLLS